MNFTGKLALIIEDDMMGVKVLQSLLNHVEVDSIVITDSYEVNAHLNEVEVPHVIFLDLEMPKNNGYNVLEFIQETPRFAGVPVVAYTTHISHINDVKRAGFHSFMGKPINSDTFADNLADIFAGNPVWEIPT